MWELRMLRVKPPTVGLQMWMTLVGPAKWAERSADGQMSRDSDNLLSTKRQESIGVPFLSF